MTRSRNTPPSDGLGVESRFQALLAKSRALFSESRIDEAIAALGAAEAADPLTQDFAVIQRAVAARDFQVAARRARDMLDREPGHPRAIFTLAHVAQVDGDHHRAAEWLSRGIDATPANLIFRRMLIGAREAEGEFVAAIEAARALDRVQGRAESAILLATVLFRYGLNEEALGICDRVEANPDVPAGLRSEARTLQGQLLKTLGRTDACVAAFRKAIEAAPMGGAPWWGLADLKTYRFSPQDRAAMQAITRKKEIPAEDRCLASFALARAIEEEGDLGAAMPVYAEANALHTGSRFDPARFGRGVDALIDAFDPAAVDTRARKSPDGPRPIFILGMPRSGSTLIEQILASHSMIEGTIEHLVLPSVRQAAHSLGREKFGADYLRSIRRLSTDDLESLGDLYQERSRLFHAGEKALVTDKMPYNFEHVGLIHKCLPHAVIIDARRHPMDCGLSIYKQHFASGSDYAYSMAHIGAYYRGYQRLMDHWHSLLPERILTVQYEHLVRDPDAQIRRILGHIGVPFEDSCLAFHKTQRPVRTASSHQVRQPLYDRSIGRWRDVEAALEPLKSALGDDILSRYDGLT